MSNLSELIYEPVTDNYGWGSYGEFKVLIRRSDGYINATKLCKDGGKELFHWSSNETSKKFVEELIPVLGIPRIDLICVVKGGNNQEITGTYVHPELIPHVASWVSPKFAIMVSKIVNNYIVREHQREIARQKLELGQKQDKIDELIAKVDRQTSMLEDQKRLLTVMNENVIESVAALHHVSDKSVPLERLPASLTEKLVIVNTEGQDYEVIRAQSKYVQSKIRSIRRAFRQSSVVVQMDLRPNSRELWIAARAAIEEAGIEVRGTKFTMPNERETWLIDTLNRCNQEKYAELLETKESIGDRINGLEQVDEKTEPQEPEAPLDARRLLAQPVADLKDICRQAAWRGWSKLNKASLVEFIIDRL